MTQTAQYLEAVNYPIKFLQLSNSSIKLYQSCHRKFELRKLCGLSQQTRELAPEVGKAMHNMYQTYLVTGDREAALFELLTKYPVDLNNNPTNPRSVEACYATAMEIMSHAHLANYEIAQIDCKDGVRRPAIEVPFRIVLKDFSLDGQWHYEPEPDNPLKVKRVPNIPVVYVGFIDAILFDVTTMNEFAVVDLKTFRDDSLDLTAKFAYDEQCLPYGMVLEHVLGGNFEGFVVKYLAAHIDIRTPRVGLYSFEKNREDIQDWARGFLATLHSIRWEFSQQWFHRNRAGESCRAWRKDCEFFQICNSRSLKQVMGMLLGPDAPDTKPAPFPEPWIELELSLEAG